MKLRQVRIKKDVVISDALTFMAGIALRSKTPMQGTSLGYITMVRFKSVIPSHKVKSSNLRVF